MFGVHSGVWLHHEDVIIKAVPGLIHVVWVHFPTVILIDHRGVNFNWPHIFLHIIQGIIEIDFNNSPVFHCYTGVHNSWWWFLILYWKICRLWWIRQTQHWRMPVLLKNYLSLLRLSYLLPISATRHWSG